MDEDDWDNAAPPLSRSDRIQRITSPEGTLQRPRSHQAVPTGPMHVGSSNSLARAAQQQQLQLAAAIIQQQQLEEQLHHVRGPGSYGHLDHMLLDPQAPSHIATLRRQAQMLALQAAHTNSLPRPAHQHPQFTVPVSPRMPQRYKHPTSLPPTTGQQMRPAGTGPLSPNMNSARRMAHSLELQLEPRGPRQHEASLQRRTLPNGYWGQHDVTAAEMNGGLRRAFDPYAAAAAQQAIYSGDGSTSSYARVNHNNRQTYPPSQVSVSQTAEPLCNPQHDENTSLTSQKTSRTQTSMLTKSAPTPSGSGSGASGSTSLPPQKQSDTTASTAASASAKYAEYISNLEKYQHPPPSKRHVTFIKYRGRQCTIAMLVVFALLVIGLVVAPVVYFTAFANKASSSNSTPQIQQTNFINGKITLDTTHGTYADLMTDPGRPPPEQGLKRIQRDMEDLLKDVLHGTGGFAADEVNKVMVSPPKRIDTHQILVDFQVLLKKYLPLEEAESKTSKAFATATTTDAVGTRLKDVPFVPSSLIYKALAQTNSSDSALTPPSDGFDNDGLSQFNTGSKLSSDLTQPDLSVPSIDYLTTTTQSTTSSSAPPPSPASNAQGLQENVPKFSFNAPKGGSNLTPPPPARSPPFTRPPSTTTTSKPTTASSSTRAPPSSSIAPVKESADESFSIGGGSKGKKTQAPPSVSSWSPLWDERPAFAQTVPLGSSSTVTESPVTPTGRPLETSPAGGFLSLLQQNKQTLAPPFQNTPSFDVSRPVSLGTSRQPEFIPSNGFTAPNSFAPNGITSFENSNFFPTSPIPRPPGASLQESPQTTGPQFVQVFDPNQNFNPQQFSPGNLNQQPQLPFSQNFQPLHDFSNGPREGPFEGRGQIPQGTFQTFGPQPPFPLNRFAADDASLLASSTAVVVAGTSTTKAPTGRTTSSPKAIVSSTKKSTIKATETSTALSSDVTEETSASGTEGKTAEKREFAPPLPALNMPMDGAKKIEDAILGKETPDSNVFSSTAPLLTSDWGNWSEWGSCSSPRCNSDGFQMRTRACMTAVNGAVPIPDHDASCTVNGGQGIEARPCVCEHPVPEETTTIEPVTAAPETAASTDESSGFPDPVPSTVAKPPPITTTAPVKANLAWSEWTDWSGCSIEPCHPNGIQTRHRTCKTEGGAGVQVPDEMCFNAEGAAVETQPCQCPVVVTPPSFEEETVTTAMFVRPATQTKGSLVQPQRAFNMQIQNRPIQRRPNATNLPRTCSFYEKPCNNGQCILSYRVCDGFPDCTDGSDEPLGCGRCFSGEFKCTNGRCISESLVCDGTDNCGDGTDEFFC